MLVEVSERTARIEEKLDSLGHMVEDHEERIRSNERWRWGIPGAGLLALISAVLGGAGHSG